MTFSVDTFLRTFLSAPNGSSPQDIAAKIRHYIDVANNPSQYSDDHGTFALRAKRRSARQSLRRLVQKHPQIAEQLMRDTKEAAQ